MALKRSLGLPMLTFYGTGMILGAGIYSIIGQAAGRAGESVWQSFLLAAVAALLTALSYAELSTMFPTAGAEYIYLRNAFPSKRWLAAMVGITVIFAGATSSATVALAFSSYLQHFIEWPRFAAAACLLGIFTAVNILGIRQSSWTNVVFTLIEAAGLVLFIWIGISAPEFGRALLEMPNLGTLSTAALVIFAFLGFENIVSLAEETKRPERNIPRAIFLSLAISTVLYVLVSLAAVALMPPEQLAQTESALIDASLKSSTTIAGILGGIALFSTANTALIGLVTTSRIIYGVSMDKSLPKILSRTLVRRQTPWLAALVAMALALLLLLFGEVEVLASLASFTTMIVFIAVNVAVIRLRFLEPSRSRPFRAAGSLKSWPLTPILAIFVSFVFLFQFEQLVYLTGLIAFACSAGVYFLFRQPLT